MSASDDIKSLQRKMNREEYRRDFVEAEVSSTSSSDEADEESVKLVLPNRRKRKHPDNETLLHEFLVQQRQIVKLERKIGKLTSTIDRDEVEMRYLKLDLNNATLNEEAAKEGFEKKKEELKECRNVVKNCDKRLYRYRVETVVGRVVMLLLLLYIIVLKYNSRKLGELSV